MTRVWLIVVALVALFALPSRASAGGRSYADANAAYKQGLYIEAIRGYESLVAAGVYHEDLFYNLGNAYFRNQQFGPAIYNYERALRIDPEFLDARDNADLARTVVAERVVDRLTGAEALPLWVRIATYISMPRLTLALLVLNAVFFAVLLSVRFLATGFLRSAMIVFSSFVGVALTICVLLFSANVYYLEQIELGIVVADETHLREGPDETLAERALVHPGLRVQIADRQSGWLRVRLANGVEGWIPGYAVGEL